MDLDLGRVIDGKYRIVKLLGKGGMGSVYLGENLRIRRRVAIKVLHAKTADKTINVQRFEREAQAAGRIGSEHIVEVLDLGELDSGDFYLVMEFLEGESLAQRLERGGPMHPEALFPIVVDLLEGLHDAHRADIVHRDLKPDNVFLLREKKGQTDFVKIVDFGVSKFKPIGPESIEVTRTGAVVGTPYYMSPEQAQGCRDIDHRTDLFAVGVILYKGLTGQVPFTAGSFNELMFKVVLEDAPSIEGLVPGIDPQVVAIVKTALQRTADARFQSAQLFQKALLDWLKLRGINHYRARISTPRLGALAAIDAAVSATPGATGVSADGGTAPGVAHTPTRKPSRKTLGFGIAALLIGGTASVIFALGNADEPHDDQNAVVGPASAAELIEAAAAPDEAATDAAASSQSASSSTSTTNDPVVEPTAKTRGAKRPTTGRPEKKPSRPPNRFPPTPAASAKPKTPAQPETVSSGRVHRRTLD